MKTISSGLSGRCFVMSSRRCSHALANFNMSPEITMKDTFHSGDGVPPDSAGVSAYARHHLTKNRLRPLVLLLTGGGKVVRGWDCEPIETQPIKEVEVRVTKHVRRDWTITTRAIVQATRVVLSERICP